MPCDRSSRRRRPASGRSPRNDANRDVAGVERRRALILGALSFAISHESYSDADLVLAFKIMDRFPALNTQFKYLRDMEP